MAGIWLISLKSCLFHGGGGTMTGGDTGGEQGPPGVWVTGSGDYRPSQTGPISLTV